MIIIILMDKMERFFFSILFFHNITNFEFLSYLSLLFWILNFLDFDCCLIIARSSLNILLLLNILSVLKVLGKLSVLSILNMLGHHSIQ